MTISMSGSRNELARSLDLLQPPMVIFTVSIDVFLGQERLPVFDSPLLQMSNDFIDRIILMAVKNEAFLAEYQISSETAKFNLGKTFTGSRQYLIRIFLSFPGISNRNAINRRNSTHALVQHCSKTLIDFNCIHRFSLLRCGIAINLRVLLVFIQASELQPYQLWQQL